MKIQISRFSTHQTAKIFALLMVVTSLLFMLPFMFLSSLVPTPTGGSSSFGFSALFILMPIFQGIFGYIMVRVGLWLYNLLSPRFGGFEFEYETIDS
ncbi:hypothetical protein AT746_11525 [Lacimicrobium alkaliphilum]|uniref:DUF3566 domain-containing protein n=1 Tax=Lacimicrobium alkaliphilum TaxID=1526571 RepID=A0A0U3BB16_9ALTE|nr:hypothetical protein AT746_11525 [Lacimicrobium alkaliphilum]